MTPTPSPEGRDVIERAARTVQRVYRGYRTRRELRGFGLSASTRWAEAFREAQWHQLHRSANLRVAPADDGLNQAQRNWQRAVSVARRAGGDDDRVSGSPSTGTQSTHIDEISSGTTAKMMDLKYFLEMVDLKHRHGSNLRVYHNYWQNSPSNQNFFYWLDYGEGQNLELEQCPRERLEKQQVRYLTREQRMNYLVTVDEAGLFRWAKSNELVWTNSTRFKDSLDGIVGMEDDAPQFIGNETTADSASISSSSSSPSSSMSSSTRSMGSVLSNEETKPFTEEEYKAAKMTKKVLHASPMTAFKRMMGKSTEKDNMWIFVADSSFRLYIGIKESGAFQHSSFLRGARIAAAGMIKIRHGQLRSLAPLSGHYRPPAANFRAFHHALQQQGVDMSHVSMSKSYMMLAGIEGYTKTKQKVRSIHGKMDSYEPKISKPPRMKAERHTSQF